MSSQQYRTKHTNALRRMENELQRLKGLFGCGWNLSILWLPGGSDCLDGEVRNDTIRVYEGNPDKAISVLRHEFLDYLVCKAVKPYQDLINVQRTTVNAVLKELQEEAHKEKERIVEKLKSVLEAQETESRFELSGPRFPMRVSERKHTGKRLREGGRI